MLKAQVLESDRPGFCHLFTVHLGQDTKTQTLFHKMDMCKKASPRTVVKIENVCKMFCILYGTQ